MKIKYINLYILRKWNIFLLNNSKRYAKIYGQTINVKEYTTFLVCDSDHDYTDINDYIQYGDNKDYIIVKQRNYNIVYTFNYYNRKLHGKTTEYDIVTGKIRTEIWYVNGLLHRDNGPAIIDKRPGITFNEYYKNGKFLYLESNM